MKLLCVTEPLENPGNTLKGLLEELVYQGGDLREAERQCCDKDDEGGKPALDASREAIEKVTAEILARVSAIMGDKLDLMKKLEKCRHRQETSQKLSPSEFLRAIDSL